MSQPLDQPSTASVSDRAGAFHEIESPLWQPLAILIVTYLVITCWNLNVQTIENPDEPRYAVPARIMLRTNDSDDWIVPKFNTEVRLKKPVLFYWLIAATGGIAQKLGVDMVTGFRMGPVLMGLLAVVGIYLLGRKLFGSRTAFLAAGILMTSRYFHEVARDLVVDMTLTGFIVLTWAFGRAALERISHPRSATLPLIAMYICAGLVCATKGPAMVLVSLFAPLLVYLYWTKNLKAFANAGLIYGVPIGILVGFGWFLWVHTHGHDMLAVFKSENVQRAVGGRDHQKYAPFVFYIVNLGENFLPWVLLVPLAVWRTIKQYKSPEGFSDSHKMMLCMLGVPFVILGVVISKRPLYSLPWYPFLALWVAWAWNDALLAIEGSDRGRRWALGLQAAAGGVLIGCAAFIIKPPAKFELQQFEVAFAVMIGAAIAVGLFAAGRNLARGLSYKSALQLVAVATALVIASEAVGRPVRERYGNRVAFWREVCSNLNQRPVVLLGESANEAVWYLDRPKEMIDNIRYPDLKSRFFDVPGMVLLASSKELTATPKLKESLTVISSPIRKEKDEFVLAKANPDVKPDPSIFEPKSKKGEVDEE